MNFTDTELCKGRTICLRCRNDEKFRAGLETIHGEWECPEGLDINSPLEFMPEPTQRMHAEIQMRQEAAEGRRNEIRETLTEIWKDLSPQARVRALRLWRLVLPKDMEEMGVYLHRSHRTCRHAGPKIDTIEQECCGGTVKEVAQYACAAGHVATALNCRGCMDYSIADEHMDVSDGLPHRRMKVIGEVFLAYGCEDCEPVREYITKLGWYGHRRAQVSDTDLLVIHYPLTNREAVDSLKAAGIPDAEIPCVHTYDGDVIQGPVEVIKFLSESGMENRDDDGFSRVFMT
jgi:hypothetical protein